MQSTFATFATHSCESRGVGLGAGFPMKPDGLASDSRAVFHALDTGVQNGDSKGAHMKTPWLARLILGAFLWIFAMATLHVVLDGLGVWQTLPQDLTHGADVLTGGALVLALGAHLVLTFGEAPRPPAA
jgi:hypothetical protein